MADSRVKGLDGLRALCALFLLWGHTGQPAFSNWSILSIPLPQCCAYVFFVISGFLAGYKSDSISLSKTYFKKKAIRLLPLYYLYLSLSIIVYIIIGRSNEVLDSRLWYYILLVPQIPFCKNDGILPLVHLWFIGSIALFYIVCPFFTRIKKEKRPSSAAIIAIGCFLLKMLVRIFVGKDIILYRIIGVTSFDTLFLGVWGGLLFRENHRLIDSIKNSRFLGFISWGLFLLSGLYLESFPAPIRPEFICFLALLVIITLQRSRRNSVLELCIFKFVGSISYEVYVIQILIIILLSYLYQIIEISLPGIVIYVICTFVVILCSWLYNRAIRLIGSPK